MHLHSDPWGNGNSGLRTIKKFPLLSKNYVIKEEKQQELEPNQSKPKVEKETLDEQDTEVKSDNMKSTSEGFYENCTVAKQPPPLKPKRTFKDSQKKVDKIFKKNNCLIFILI